MHLSFLVCTWVLIACCYGQSENFAYKKDCKQSTVANPNAPKPRYCYYANDGNKSTVCSRTQFNDGLRKWWLVDLNTTVQVESVSITNNYLFPGRLHNFTIKTFHLNPTIFYPYGSMCYQYVGELPENTTTLNCSTPSSGRYLEIAKPDMNDSPLDLCQVEVYGQEISTQVTGSGYCENKESRMEANNKTIDTTITVIECARKCDHEPWCHAFNYEHLAISNNCIILLEIGPISYNPNVTNWKKCIKNEMLALN